jgi:hypothetical protein
MQPHLTLKIEPTSNFLTLSLENSDLEDGSAIYFTLEDAFQCCKIHGQGAIVDLQIYCTGYL